MKVIILLALLGLPPEGLAGLWSLEASEEGTWLPTVGLLTEQPGLHPSGVKGPARIG